MAVTYCAMCRCATDYECCCGLPTFTQDEIDIIVEWMLTEDDEMKAERLRNQIPPRKFPWALIGGLLFSLATWACVGWFFAMLWQWAWK